MRIRSIRPEFWRSEDVAAMDWHTRLIFIGLWSYVDDNGVGRDDERMIVADLFSLDMDAHGSLREPSLRVQSALTHLSKHGQITRYEVDGRRFLHITSWKTHQKINRPTESRYPLPTSDNAVSVSHHDGLTEDSVRPQANVALGEGEKGRRGEGEKKSELRPDAARILDLLDARVTANRHQKPARNKGNLDAARLLTTSDGYPLPEIERIIEFATQDQFWRANIRSMAKFREKYTTLRAQAESKGWLNPGANIRSINGRQRRDIDAHGNEIPEALR